VPPDDLTTLTRRISELVAHPELRRSMGTCGRERVVADFDEARMVERLAALYQRLSAEAGISGLATPEHTPRFTPEGHARRTPSESV
jgi:hypothetical protein